MHHSIGVGGGEARGQLARMAQGLVGRQRAVGEAIAQRPALEQLGDDVRLTSVDTDVVHVEDVGLLQRCGGARLDLESAKLLVAVRARRQHLDGDLPAEPQVDGGEHPPHAAAADLLLDRVALAEQRVRRR